MNRLRYSLTAIAFSLSVLSAPSSGQENNNQTTARPVDPGQPRERTCFQTHARWAPELQLRSDVAVCYGIDATLPGRIAQWKAQGYITHLMTGVSWGQYQDYLYGRFDGQKHVDEAQTDRFGRVISHGGDVYYMCPGEGYGRFLTQGVKRAMDAGAEAIHLEEPEFWVRAGYSDGFKREWKAYYHEDWIAPHTSPDAQYRASQLKYYLYRRALGQVFDFVKAENTRTGRKVRCYVPTHSLINYAHWKIVSPESSLVKVGADGYIAQVWTGTARTPNVYRGVTRERTFETAFFEYGAMMNVVRAGGGAVWFLNDPIEDNPDHSWEDYRANWESTLTASLLWPQVWRYEVMPWPERIYFGRYPTVDRARRKAGERVTREPIPASYATELQTVITALNDMDQPDVSWECGTRNIGIVVSDTMMFQRGEPAPSDPHLGSFYGLALPLLKRGIPAEPVQLENATMAGALKPYRVLLMTYEGMKPMTPDVHDALADWVRGGGVLLFLGDDSDPFNAVRSWWNEPGKTSYKAPREHLFARLGLSGDTAVGFHRVGQGGLLFDRVSPASLTYRRDGDVHLSRLVETACKEAGITYQATNHLVLRRGPYVVAAGLDEPAESRPPITLKGHFVDLFDARLSVLESINVTPGSRRLLLDVDRARAKFPDQKVGILASACKILGATTAPDAAYRFHAEGPEKTTAVVRLACIDAPKEVTLDANPLPAEARIWDPLSKTLLLTFPNSARGHEVTVR